MLLAGKTSEFPEFLDLSSERLAAIDQMQLGGDLGPLQRLDAALASGPPYRFEAGPLVVYTDPRWFTSLPPTGAGAPFIELHRWPGDSILTLYSLAGPLSNAESGGPILAGVTLELQTVDESRSVWRGQLKTSTGERPIWWIERRIESASGVLGAALLPGDAGLGSAGIPGRTQEMLHLLSKIEVGRSWTNYPPHPRSEPLLMPTVGDPPGDKSERTDPWQVVRTAGFTLGLPPGFRALRTEGGVQAPYPVAGQVLWFRGVVTDNDGEELRIGDGWRVGYVSRVEGEVSGKSGWLRSVPAALHEKTSALERSQPFPLLAERVQAETGYALRFSEVGWKGQWFIFRMVFDDHGFEIGLPVVRGATLPSLYWIPLTWRDRSRAPAPPPVDPAERFGIRFDRLRPLERKRKPWAEGTFEAPGMTMEMPRGWYPAASLRSIDGYPVRLIDENGSAVGSLRRLDSKAVAVVQSEASTWAEVQSRGSGQRKGAYRREDGALLLIAKRGHGFLLKPESDGDLPPLWERLVESVQLRRERRSAGE